MNYSFLQELNNRIVDAARETNTAIANSKDICSNNYLCGYKMALNDVLGWMEKLRSNESVE